jgi:uncharacterized protein (DUF4415 family)
MDDKIVSQFKAQSEKTGKGYQTLINEALKAYLGLRGATRHAGSGTQDCA